MPAFLGTPKVQFFDSNGNPLIGGKLYSYSPGTTTNKATYPSIADAENSTNPNTNPIILDSRGEASVVLSGKTKLKLTDADDTLIWIIDNVSSGTGLNDRLDSSANEVLVFNEAASATNYIILTNSATGTAVSITSVGDDTNVGLTLDTKGSGTLTLSSQDVAVTTDADTVDLHTGGSSRADITDSGLRIGGSGARVNSIENGVTTPDATTLVTQAAVKALGTAVGTLIWSSTTYSGGTPTLNDSLGVSSITDSATGVLQVNHTSTLSDANCCVVGSYDNTSAAIVGYKMTHGSSNHKITTMNSSGTNTDPDKVSTLAFGST